MKLEDIGFYTLEDYRIMQQSDSSPMWRCELIITDICNFSCSYCRGLRPDCRGMMSLDFAKKVIDIWSEHDLRNIRFSGGEPTTHPDLKKMIRHARKSNGNRRIALSTNGSNSIHYYNELIEAGVNDFSISLDGCCAADIDTFSGKKGFGKTVINNIRELAKKTYVTVGVVVTDDNYDNLNDIIKFSHDLGVADIRIIPSAQYNRLLEIAKKVPESILNCHPILKYRVGNILKNRNVRGIKSFDCDRCHLMNDDSVVAGEYHFPCVIYMREGGAPIGKVNRDMRKDRKNWLENHDTHSDPICKNNCLDVCIDYNNRYKDLSFVSSTTDKRRIL
jgi:pyruvate-formate lyase-activating enzyme